MARSNCLQSWIESWRWRGNFRPGGDRSRIARRRSRSPQLLLEELESRVLLSGLVTQASFINSNGANPYGGVIEDSHGNLFGTTRYGGPSNDGTVWELAAGSSSITTLASFNGDNGADPQAGLIEDGQG